MVKPVARAQNELYKPVREVSNQQSQWRGRKISMPDSYAEGPITVLKSKTGSCDVVRIRTCAYIALGCFMLAWSITSIILMTKCTNPYADGCPTNLIAGAGVAAGGGIVTFIAIICLRMSNKNDYEPV